jgi:hypothetical protein
VQEGLLSKREMELNRLEEKYPGITRLNRQADGSIDFDVDSDADN